MAPDRPRNARVYLHRGGTRLIVATLHSNQDGMLFEAEGPLSLSKWDDNDLGDGVKMALEQSGMITRDLRGLKPEDWPSLKVSREPSVRSFQSVFIQVEISGSGPVCRIEAVPETSWDLKLRTSVPAQASALELARRITQIFQTCRDRKF